ncbi:MAG: PDZ domain-containing protein [Candidatus Rokubacteria bacterium]|nr:PDZ domain-containing protein [Candidatus Rokubacteria bacterium]
MSRRLTFALLLVAAALSQAAGATWGWLGVRIRDISEPEMDEISRRHGIREGFGALIVEVMADTPAARGGLKNGDLVVAFRDRPVVDTRSLQRVVAATPAGEEVVLTVLRTEEGRRRVTVRVGTMPREVLAERIAAEFGFLLGEMSREREGTLSGASDVPIVGVVLRGSPAERAGLKSGDLIVEVNGRPVASRQAARELLAGVGLDQPLGLTVGRGADRVRLTLGPAAAGSR